MSPHMLNNSILKNIFASLTLCSALFANTAMAAYDSCDIELKYGVIIEQDDVRIMGPRKTVIQINDDKQLFVNGEWIMLDEPTTKLLTEYSLGLRTEIPKMVSIAMDGITLGFEAINQVVNTLSGSASPALKEQFEGLKFRFRKKFDHTGDIFYIAPQSLNELDDFFEDELTSEVNEIVTDSLGAMLLALGEAINTEGDLEGNKVDFGEQMEQLSAQIEKQLSEKSGKLKAHAHQFCQSLRGLDRIETQLQQRVPILMDYDVVALKEDD